MAKSDYKKDIKGLVKAVRKVGKKVADKGSYEERTGKHLVIQFLVGAKLFAQTFPITPGSYSSVKRTYADTRRKLLFVGIQDPRFSVRMSSGVDEWDEIFGDIHELLDSVIPLRDETSPSVRLYLDDVEKLHPQATKPYKTKISYVSKKGNRERKKITYDRYYVLGERTDWIGRKTNGFLAVRKPVFVEALIMWKQIRKK